MSNNNSFAYDGSGNIIFSISGLLSLKPIQSTLITISSVIYSFPTVNSISGYVYGTINSNSYSCLTISSFVFNNTPCLINQEYYYNVYSRMRSLFVSSCIDLSGSLIVRSGNICCDKNIYCYNSFNEIPVSCFRQLVTISSIIYTNNNNLQNQINQTYTYNSNFQSQLLNLSSIIYGTNNSNNYNFISLSSVIYNNNNNLQNQINISNYYNFQSQLNIIYI